MSMKQRESNSGKLSKRMYQNTTGEKHIRNISYQDKWPVNKSYLVNKRIKHFTQFVNSIHFARL